MSGTVVGFRCEVCGAWFAYRNTWAGRRRLRRKRAEHWRERIQVMAKHEGRQVQAINFEDWGGNTLTVEKGDTSETVNVVAETRFEGVTVELHKAAIPNVIAYLFGQLDGDLQTRTLEGLGRVLEPSRGVTVYDGGKL
ncbi:hypothetical protein KDJ57_gp38 [Gordonia phage Catfish]|uniref:Uncharacterized protein n=1 Tax=Gordonia phage Catfish TaxID=2301538 RepID=A0A385D2I5_9CAUD|nr:hypothetical protein KDJ57_gp38 [Gordonia phage Catfish]AXQ51907.1 hypothetical protein SEA_CATFISH_71 [Gordonia phage Catfish]